MFEQRAQRTGSNQTLAGAGVYQDPVELFASYACVNGIVIIGRCWKKHGLQLLGPEQPLMTLRMRDTTMPALFRH